jgi:hypothetical protein
MILRQLMGGSAAAIFGAGTILASVVSTQAAMLPVSHVVTPSIHHVDCAVGAHIGPLGGCIIGDDNPAPPPVVIERRAVDAPPPDNPGGCATKSVTRTDGAGNSETKTVSNC